jgi:hypothetical protein
VEAWSPTRRPRRTYKGTARSLPLPGHTKSLSAATPPPWPPTAELPHPRLPTAGFASITSTRLHRRRPGHSLARIGRRFAGTRGPAATAAGLRRASSPVAPCPNRARESSPRGPRSIPRPRPAGPGRRFAGIWPDRHLSVPGDDIARFAIFLGSFVQSKDMVVNLQKLPRASAQTVTSIVLQICRNL